MKRSKTPTFLLELPLQVNPQQASHLRAHFEAARFCALRQEYGFSEYSLHASATKGRTAWIADHIDSNTAQQQDRLPALIDWHDPVIKHGLSHPIKYVRLLRRRASSPQAQGEARLLSFCQELKTDQRKKRRLQRKLDRERRANNPQNYDQKGRMKKGKKLWRESQGYKATRRHLASQERKLAAHRKSLHGRLVHEIVQTGNTIITEKLSYKAWQKRYGKSVRTHGPGMFIERLKRTRASNWRHPERDLYSAFLACHLDLRTFVPSLAQATWESEGDVRELRLRAAIEDVQKRATAREALPQSFGLSRAGARLPGSLVSDQQELRLRMLEAVARWQEPPAFSAGESQYEQHNME